MMENAAHIYTNSQGTPEHVHAYLEKNRFSTSPHASSLAHMHGYTDYKHLTVRHDRELGVLWYFMQPTPRPCFTNELLHDIGRLQAYVKQACEQELEESQNIKFLVLASRRPGIFNLGGDLDLFLELLKNKDREALKKYAISCIDVLYPNAVNLNLPITTISLVQGNALGGGFEAALSSNVFIAEKGVQMGLPEILFNLFPGMGAYSFLSRRLDAARAERMILSGRTYTSDELYEMGLIDVLAEPGDGEQAVRDYVKKQSRFGLGTRAVHKVRQQINPISYQELRDVALVWVDTALKLEARDLRVMQRLVKAQTRLNPTELPDAA